MLYPDTWMGQFDRWRGAVSERSVAVELFCVLPSTQYLAAMNRQPPGLDFLILLAEEQPEGVHERLAGFLSAQFPPHKFGVGLNEAGFEDEAAFSVVAMLSDAGGLADAMPYPEQHVMDAIADAVRQFLNSGTGRLN
jgi:hypothetical protein